MAIRGAADGRAESKGDLGSLSTNIGSIRSLAYLNKAPEFSNWLVSLPFLDAGGILADGGEAEESLFSEVIRLGRTLGASVLDLRHE